MQRFILVLLTMFGVIGSSSAQHIFLGERLPKLKSVKWLGNHEPTATRRTHIEFFDTRNVACQRSIEQLHKEIETTEPNSQLVIVPTQARPRQPDFSRNIYPPHSAWLWTRKVIYSRFTM